MNTLEHKIFNEIETLTFDEFSESTDAMQVCTEITKACTDITIEFAKLFYEWARKERYEMYWGNDQPNCGKWYVSYTTPDRKYFTTDELITKYINTLK